MFENCQDAWLAGFTCRGTFTKNASEPIRGVEFVTGLSWRLNRRAAAFTRLLFSIRPAILWLVKEAVSYRAARFNGLCGAAPTGFADSWDLLGPTPRRPR